MSSSAIEETGGNGVAAANAASGRRAAGRLHHSRALGHRRRPGSPVRPPLTGQHVRRVWTQRLTAAPAEVIEAAGPLAVPLEQVRVFSLGTTADVQRRSRRLDRGGLVPWARDAVEVIMRAQSTSVTNQVRHLITAERLLRLNPIVPTGAIALDRLDADALIGRAAHESRVASPSFTRCFADHRASEYVPCHPTRKD